MRQRGDSADDLNRDLLGNHDRALMREENGYYSQREPEIRNCAREIYLQRGAQPAYEVQETTRRLSPCLTSKGTRPSCYD